VAEGAARPNAISMPFKSVRRGLGGNSREKYGLPLSSIIAVHFMGRITGTEPRLDVQPHIGNRPTPQKIEIFLASS
jgi:hypothetical protein